MAKAKIYTRTGDRGSSQLLSVGRVPKHHPRLASYGEIDELNSFIGLAIAQGSEEPLTGMLGEIQNLLFVLGSQIAVPSPETAGFDIPSIRPADTECLEGWIDDIDAQLPELTSFILPGGTTTAATLHVARTVCRRVERNLNALEAEEGTELPPEVRSFVNRLSDFLFSAARLVNQNTNLADQPWVKR